MFKSIKISDAFLPPFVLCKKYVLDFRDCVFDDASQYKLISNACNNILLNSIERNVS